MPRETREVLAQHSIFRPTPEAARVFRLKAETTAFLLGDLGSSG